LSNTTFQNYDDIIERSCQAWNEILSEDGFIKNLCSREWSFIDSKLLNLVDKYNEKALFSANYRKVVNQSISILGNLHSF
jgi:hypothetical protein